MSHVQPLRFASVTACSKAKTVPAAGRRLAADAESAELVCSWCGFTFFAVQLSAGPSAASGVPVGCLERSCSGGADEEVLERLGVHGLDQVVIEAGLLGAAAVLVLA